MQKSKIDTITNVSARIQATAAILKKKNDSCFKCFCWYWNNKNEPAFKEQINIYPKQNYLGNCYFVAAVHQIITKASYIFDKIMIFCS